PVPTQPSHSKTRRQEDRKTRRQEDSKTGNTSLLFVFHSSRLHVFLSSLPVFHSSCLPVFSGAVGPLGVSLQLVGIEVHLAQVAGGVPLGLIVEVLRRRVAALAAGG